MRQACPCGSPLTVRHGSEPSSHLRLDGGKAERVPCPRERFLCKACTRTFAVRPPSAEAAEREVRNHVAELSFRLGRAGAGRDCGLLPSVVRRLLDEWREGREGDALHAAPDFILLERVTLRNAEAVLVADVDGETLVEVVPDADAFGRWVRGRDVPPLRACVPIDPALSASVRIALPEAVVMVAPSSVTRAISTALASGLRSLRREPSMRNRNAFPGVARFLRALEGRVSNGEGWPFEVTALLTAGRIARAISGAGNATRASRLWPEFDLAVSTPGGGPLASLMATWRGAILAGLDHRFVERMAGMMARVRRLASARRPSLVPGDFRALVLLRDYQRGTERGWLGTGAAVAHGRPLAGLDDLLKAGLVPWPA